MKILHFSLAFREMYEFKKIHALGTKFYLCNLFPEYFIFAGMKREVKSKYDTEFIKTLTKQLACRAFLRQTFEACPNPKCKNLHETANDYFMNNPN